MVQAALVIIVYIGQVIIMLRVNLGAVIPYEALRAYLYQLLFTCQLPVLSATLQGYQGSLST
jgi:hypothetical protein